MSVEELHKAGAEAMKLCEEGKLTVEEAFIKIAAKHLIGMVVMRLMLIQIIRQRHGMETRCPPFIEPKVPVTKHKTWWWLSYAGEEGNRGGVFMDGDDFLEACHNAHVRKISPGGEVKGMKCDDEIEADGFGPFQPYTLYTREQIDSLDTSGTQNF